MNIGKVLKRIRDSRGMTQVQAAKKCGITRTTLSLIECKGERMPEKKTLANMAEVYGVPLEAIFMLSSNENENVFYEVKRLDLIACIEIEFNIK